MTDRNGEKRWAVLTPAEWEVDTGLNKRQYSYSLNILKKAKLIIWKNQHKGKPSGNPPLWAKISDEIREIIESAELHDCTQVSNTDVTQVEEPSHTDVPPIYNTVNTKTVNTKCVTGEPDSESDSKLLEEDSRKLIDDCNVVDMKGNKMKKGGGKGLASYNAKKGKTFEEVEDAVTNKPRKTIIKNVTQFEFFWKDIYAEHFPIDEFRSWNPKLQGYAKTVIRNVEDVQKKNSEFTLATVMGAILDNWEEFADFACAEKGQDRPPRYPNIGFVAASFQEVLLWYTDFLKENVHVHAEDGDVQWRTKQEPGRKKSVIRVSQKDKE